MVEYLLLLGASIALLIGVFSSSKGPVKMFSDSGPVLAVRIEQRLITGQGFFERPGGDFLDWQR